MSAGIVWCLVPAGAFPMGSDPAGAYPPDQDETPRRRVHLEPFRLARLPVSNAQYGAFAAATGRTAPAAQPGEDTVPVTYVTRDDAEAFCAWAGVRLPSEDEWEAAARGGDDRLWPWGDEPPDPTRAVFAAGIGRPRPAGRHPHGASVDGVLDLAGNVQEWVAGDYVHGSASARSGLPAGVVRGGSFLHGPDELRCSYRQPTLPATRDHYVGFRVAAADGEPRVGFDWVEIPGGEVAVGRDPVAPTGPLAADELPRSLVEVGAFELSLTPVTNDQYARFVRATGAPPPAHWVDGSPQPGTDEHPVVYVDWFDARAFCAWAGGRLPTEAEWEKAARGADGLVYPWGDEPDRGRAAIGAGLKRGTTSQVHAHPDGASPYGLLDMAGNVWEWVSSLYRPYPFDPADGREDPAADGERVLRGGSFASPRLDYARGAMRSRSRPARRQSHIGFRITRSTAA